MAGSLRAFAGQSTNVFWEQSKYFLRAASCLTAVTSGCLLFLSLDFKRVHEITIKAVRISISCPIVV